MIKGKQGQCSIRSNQSGFTIVESLVAMLVVAILMTAITPVIVLSVATRVQSKRVEQATQAARAYVDGLRTGAIRPPNTTIELATNQYFLQGVAAPIGTQSALTDLYCVDLDNLDNDGLSFDDPDGCTVGSARDLAIQAFRSVTASSIDPNNGYRLGLRIYRADAFSDGGLLKRNEPDRKVTQATFTGGLGDRKAPIVEMMTEIFVTDKTTYQNYCTRLGGCE